MLTDTWKCMKVLQIMLEYILLLKKKTYISCLKIKSSLSEDKL